MLEEGLTPYSTLTVEGWSLDSIGGRTGLSTIPSGISTNGAFTSHSLSLSSTPISAAAGIALGRSGGSRVSSSISPAASTNFRSVIVPK